MKNIFYLKKNKHKKPKELFKVAYKLLKNIIDNKKDKKALIADFGCATGEFVSYLSKNINNKIIGFDIEKKFIIEAKKKLPTYEFKKLNITANSKIYKDKFDILFSLGVASHFDSIEKYLESLIFYSKKKGTIIIESLFNNYDLDVRINHRYSNDKNGKWYSDWNFSSKKTVKNYLTKNTKVKSFYFQDFDLNKTLIRKKEPIRSWTIKVDGKKKLTNGLMFVQQHSFLIIKLK